MHATDGTDAHTLAGTWLERRLRGRRGEREVLDRLLASVRAGQSGGLLSAVAGEQPLVCVVDDAQWLDRASAQALAFAARRLGTGSVAVVFAVRSPGAGQDLSGLAELVVSGLPDGAARALLESVVI